MNSEREIVSRLFESKYIDEGHFEYNGSEYDSAFGNYAKDGEVITRDEYLKARELYDKENDSSSKSPKTKSKVSAINSLDDSVDKQIILESALKDYCSDLNITLEKPEKVPVSKHLDYISDSFDQANDIVDKYGFSEWMADDIVQIISDYTGDNQQPEGDKVDVLNKYLDEAPTFYDGKSLLYRGMHISNDDKGKQYIQNLLSARKGDVLKLEGFTGFSTDPYFATSFSLNGHDQDKRVLIVNSKNVTGVSLTNYSEYPEESEVLFSNNAKLLIQDVKDMGDVIMVHVKEKGLNEVDDKPRVISIGLMGNQHVDKKKGNKGKH